MRITKWVDIGDEVGIDIDVNDIRGALTEAFARTEQGFEELPTITDILRAFNQIGAFLNAFEQQHIDRLTLGHRSIIAAFLSEAADRFKVPETYVGAFQCRQKPTSPAVGEEE